MEGANRVLTKGLKWLDWRDRKVNRRMHWLNKYKLARGCDLCGYGRVRHGLQAVLAKGLDWAHINPLSKSLVLVGRIKGDTMYALVRKIVRNPVKNRQYRKELFEEIRKCRLLCKLCHIGESDERNESGAGYALSMLRKNKPIPIEVKSTQQDMFL